MNGFEPGLFDKLFDDELSLSTAMLRRMSAEEMKGVVAHDLESLLNARISLSEADLELYPQCSRSVLTYGLNDFAGMSLVSHYDRVYICNSLQNAIARHESRLRQVEVSLVGKRRAGSSALCFNISAVLMLPGIREPVNFDAMLQPTTLQYSVSKARPQPVPY
ncbi:type VI secretion system baseplate subunit TssE [Comamonas sp. GB3 AK4-5]|uniref:type VI secretion system baseplate subunit TssE n=1 Tax=Comamonas sp. GB3 AK4-5 TaxID=3231487 RepID=UPI00351F557E